MLFPYNKLFVIFYEKSLKMWKMALTYVIIKENVRSHIATEWR